MSTYELGSVVRLAATTKDSAGVLTDPSALTLTITLPDRSTSSVTWAGAQIVKDSTGTFHYDYTPAQSGHYSYRFVSTGTAAGAYADEFDVRPSTPAYLVSLGDVKLHLGMSATDTTNDGELRNLIEAATPVIERFTGPVVPRTVVEWHDGGRGGRSTINVRQRPLASVTSITEYLSNVAYSLTEAATPAVCTQFSFTVDTETGTITRRITAGVAYPFPGGQQNIAVTYVAGFTVTPANVRTGALEVIRHVWQSTQQGGRPGFKRSAGADSDGPAGRGYLLSYFAQQFFQPNERIPGIA